MAGERVLVALSGGVDSAVAAGLLRERGHDLVAVTLHLWDAAPGSAVGRCCAPEDREDARRVADHLGIPHYVLDQREAFRSAVVEPYLDELGAGRTPSPCVQCNREVKLGFLFGLADSFGARRVATGHYARVRQDPGVGWRLLRGLDPAKDQSYFLFGVPDADLARLLLPLGGLDKTRARAHARRLGLPNADKADSQELCFIPDGDVAAFAARERGAPPAGKIRDERGAELGEHAGVTAFTVGQRRGLGLGGGPARYVLRVVPERAEIVVGARDALLGRTLRAVGARWAGPAPRGEFEAEVRIRHRHAPAPARVRPTEDGFEVRFEEAQQAITPGQATVLYRGDEVIGGGFIAASEDPAA